MTNTGWHSFPFCNGKENLMVPLLSEPGAAASSVAPFIKGIWDP